MNEEIGRLKADLGAMERAIGLGLPFGPRDVRRMWMAAISGLPLLVVPLVADMAAPWPGLLTVVSLLVALGILSAGGAGKADGTGGGQWPARWREHRLGVFVFVVLSTAAFGYLAVAVWKGVSLMSAVATAVFFTGAASAVPAGTDPRRRYLWGAALPTMAFAAVLPVADDLLLMLATGGWILLSGAGTAAIMKHQLDEQGEDEPD